MTTSILTISEASWKDRRLNFGSCGRSFFPEDAFGGSQKKLSSNAPVILHVDGFTKEIRTDLPTDQKGRPRYFFRDRSWIRDFIDFHGLKPGDQFEIIRLDERNYHIKPVKKNTLTFIDLFAGIGGIRTAFEAAGAKCVFSSEWNKYAQQTYFANFEEMPVGDITKINEKDIPDHDILCAGFPCQPFSIAGVSKKNALGRKHGFADETQGTLFFDILRILKEKQPRAFMLENVRNLKSHDKGRTFKVIKDHLEALGYSVKERVIDGQITVPQHRERIYLIGTKPARDFEFPEEKEFSEFRLATRLGDILDKKVEGKYTLTDHLWTYLQNYKEKHRKAGNGFGFGLVGPNDITRTLSARYYKDGSEILIEQKGKNPRRLTPRECARLMGFDKPGESKFQIPVSDMQAYKQFGNSVVVPVVKAIAQKLVKCLEDNKKYREVLCSTAK